MNNYDQTSDDGHVLYPEIQYSDFRKWKREKKMNDVLWSLFLGACFFFGMLWAWNVYQIILR